MQGSEIDLRYSLSAVQLSVSPNNSANLSNCCLSFFGRHAHVFCNLKIIFVL